MNQNTVVLIFGGSSGFGERLAVAFENSMNVYVTGRRESSRKGYIQHNMNDLNQEFLERINPDIIINNGFTKNNYTSSYQASLTVLRESFNYLKNKGHGKIMNINSISGLIPDTMDPDYAAAKHALKGYSSSITFDAYKSGIQIMDIYPRAIATGMNLGRQDFDDLIDADELAEFLVSLCRQKSFYVGSIQIDRVR